MYRFVLLSIGFNLNMVYLYLTFSPLSVSLLLLHCAVGAFEEEASLRPVCAGVTVPVAALKRKAEDVLCVPPFLLMQSDGGTVH